MRKFRYILPVVLLTGMTACDFLGLGGPSPDVINGVYDSLRDGDLLAAYNEAAILAENNPEAVDVIQLYAYTEFLAGNYDAADDALLKAEQLAEGDALRDIKLRRAIVALRLGDLEAIKKHGGASGLPAGYLLQAESLIVGMEEEAGADILRQLRDGDGVVADTAKTYLRYMDDPSGNKNGLASVSAMWALNSDRDDACSLAAESMVELEDGDEEKNTLLILWAGRAVVEGNVDAAEMMLDAAVFVDPKDIWRKKAVEAMVKVSRGEGEEAVLIFTQLKEAGAPIDGLMDALATAAGLSEDRQLARNLAQSVLTSASARGLYQAGAARVAANVAPDGALKMFLENESGE